MFLAAVGVNNMTILKKFLFAALGLVICGQALAQNASLLPNAKQTFVDQNGRPLTSGTVTFYVPNTTTFKTTWQDAAQTILNTNPVVLDAAGRAIIYGLGDYRQVVRDRLGNIIWDQVTSSGSSSGGGGGGGSTDTNAVGTVLLWSGFTPPTNYVFAYGQELVRATFPNLLTTVTQTLNVTCSAGSPTLTGIIDTSQLPNGAKVESTCAPPNSFIVSKTSTTITLNVNSGSSLTTTAVFFPYGNGNGSTTFNVPDYRGRVMAGRDNMGGVDSGRLTSTYFGSNASAIGASGGAESQTLTIAQMPSHTHTYNDPGHAHAYSAGVAQAFGTGAGSSSTVPTTFTSGSAVTGITINATGGGSAHPNVQPTITANYIIKVLSSN
jgi:microcystin-dependent protein